MAYRTQIAKIDWLGNTYTITKEIDKNASQGVFTFRIYRAWNEYREGTYPLRHKKQIGKTSALFPALMAIVNDICRKEMVMIPAQYLKELQALRNV